MDRRRRKGVTGSVQKGRSPGSQIFALPRRDRREALGQVSTNQVLHVVLLLLLLWGRSNAGLQGRVNLVTKHILSLHAFKSSVRGN